MSSNNQTVLEMRNVCRSFEQGGQRLDILKNVNLAISRGEIVALLGPSGSGKTTLLQIAGLLENPTSGDVIINGQKVPGTADSIRTELRRHQIGFVYQFHHLLPDFTALENLLLPQYVAGTPKAEAKNRALKLLESVGLAHRAGHYPSQMSGGRAAARGDCARSCQPSGLAAGRRTDGQSGSADSRRCVSGLAANDTVAENRRACGNA